jgi:cellobiose phosphorylase
MQYGHFDDLKKEYVIDRPDTPKSWSNYLGSTEYGAIITNNAGGYSFYKSAARGRFMRLRFNAVPMDQPGRYFYLHDRDKKDYWSTSWQPVGKPLDQYKSLCRHGTAYTIIESEYDLIKSEACYFVPLGRNFEIWKLKITNNDTQKRRLRLFTYVEYANNWHQLQDQFNLQYTQYILRMNVEANIIDHGINVSLPDDGGDFENHDGNRHTFLGISGTEVSGFDTDRDQFLGPYRSYHNPLAVEKGTCSNSLAYGDNGCGVLQVDVELQAGETKELAVIMGIGKAEREGKAALSEFSSMKAVDKAFDQLVKSWHDRLGGLWVETPDPEFNSMTNMWSPFNCLMTFAWSRAASLVYSGERDGLGYRDTVQDILGVLHTVPDEARKRLELMLTGQCANGGALPVVRTFSHQPGHEKAPDEKDYRSDDALWLFNAVPAYVKESGNIDFYFKVLPFADEGEASVLRHLRRAIEFNLNRSGAHGLPCGLQADWNDCLELGHNGETVFVAMQVRFALKTYNEINRLIDDETEISWAEEQLTQLDQNIDQHCWDGQWYVRAFRFDGTVYGSSSNKEGSIWLNPQSWSVLSGHANKQKAQSAMQAVHEQLATDHGIMVCAPPYVETDHKIVKAPLFNPGMKENASIFSHTQGWAVMAEALAGNGNRAYNYLRAFMPAAYNNKAEIRQIEPYVNCQFTHSIYSPRVGASRLPWLTGAATWSYYAAATAILGIQPEYNGLRIDPCIPSHWKSFRAKRRFRGKIFDITVYNENGAEKGVQKMMVNGNEIEGNLIADCIMDEQNKVEVFMP